MSGNGLPAGSRLAQLTVESITPRHWLVRWDGEVVKRLNVHSLHGLTSCYRPRTERWLKLNWVIFLASISVFFLLWYFSIARCFKTFFQIFEFRILISEVNRKVQTYTGVHLIHKTLTPDPRSRFCFLLYSLATLTALNIENRIQQCVSYFSDAYIAQFFFLNSNFASVHPHRKRLQSFPIWVKN